jgi:hypothetical protein
VQRAGQARLERGFGARELAAVLDPMRNAEALVEPAGALSSQVQRLLAAEDEAKALALDQLIGTRRRDQRCVLIDGMRDQAAVGLGRASMGVGLRMTEIAQQGPGHLEQAAGMPVDLGAKAERGLEQEAGFARKGIGLDSLALDQAGIAGRGFLPRRAPGDHPHVEAALLQLQRRAGADHAGTDHQDLPGNCG